MLVLSRKPGQSIIIDGKITVKLLRIDCGQVGIGIEAPDGVSIVRAELLEKAQEQEEEETT